MGKWCLHASSFIFGRIIIKFAGNQDRHKSLDEFDFGPLVSMAHLYVFWNERISSLACGWSKDLFFSIPVWLAKADVSSVSNRLLTQEMLIEKGITCGYTPSIYAEGYKAFIFRLSVRPFIWCLLPHLTLAHWTQVSDLCPFGYLFAFLFGDGFSVSCVTELL